MVFFYYTIAENKLRNRVWKGCFFYLSTLQLISVEVSNIHFVTLSYYKFLILRVALAEVLLKEAENMLKFVFAVSTAKRVCYERNFTMFCKNCATIDL